MCEAFLQYEKVSTLLAACVYRSEALPGPPVADADRANGHIGGGVVLRHHLGAAAFAPYMLLEGSIGLVVVAAHHHPPLDDHRSEESTPRSLLTTAPLQLYLLNSALASSPVPYAPRPPPRSPSLKFSPK